MWKQWADDLKLTDAQKVQIRAAMQERFRAHAAEHGEGGGHRWAGGGEHGAKVLSAFKQDRFVMDEVAPPHDVSKIAARMSDHMLGLAETVLPLLTPDQRALAAQKIREKADAPNEMGLAF
jgi:hypothetical protein